MVDNHNGTYSARFKVDRPGQWLVRPRINRRYVGGDGYVLHAAAGALSAMEYALKGTPEEAVETGICNSLVVATAVEGASVTGSEVFTAILTGAAHLIVPCLCAVVYTPNGSDHAQDLHCCMYLVRFTS